MQVITYLGFTLISILIQFSVMDFILEKPQADRKALVANVTSNRKQFRDILQEYSNKPHALYYRTGLSHLKEYKNVTPTLSNSSKITATENTLETTTDTLTTTFEEVYDESASMIDIETTTDSFYSSTEFENVTEFVLFEKKFNNTVNKSNIVPMRTFTKDMCDCNFLFKVCDINCCCDSDCSGTEINLFKNCDEALDKKQSDVCYPQLSVKTQPSNSFSNLFCIAKTNLPEKRNRNKYSRESAIKTMEITLKWQKMKVHKDNNIEFMKKQYSYGDPIWLLKNGFINYLDVASPLVNNYCTGRKMIQFLKEESIKCNVQLKHLEMIQVLKTAEESTVISVMNHTLNASVLNCSNVHCTNWTVIICDDASCTAYNKSTHEPFCTDSQCTYIAPKIDYIFYYHDSKIVNATMKLYIQNVSMTLPHMTQDISVHFYLANISIAQAVQFSGAPGYVPGLPVIVSYGANNHTEHFFNGSLKNHFTLPINKNGKCNQLEIAQNLLQFGPNRRIKCRFSLEPKFLSYNSTHACKMIHNSIQEYLRMNYTIFVSPSGNPHGQTDEQWLSLEMQSIEKETIHGEFFNGKSNLLCRNIATDVFLIFTYADQSIVNDKVDNKILTAVVQMAEQNVTLNVDDFSIVLTVDTTFIDVTKPPVYEFAGSPDLKIHLPADFFFPFPNSAFVMPKTCSCFINFRERCLSIMLIVVENIKFDYYFNEVMAVFTYATLIIKEIAMLIVLFALFRHRICENYYSLSQVKNLEFLHCKYNAKKKNVKL